MGLARKPKVPESAGQGKLLGLPGRTGEPVLGPCSVDLSQPSKQRVSQGDPKKMVPGSLEEKEVHEKKELEENNTKAWKKREVKEEECKSKLVLPHPPRLVKRSRRRKVKLPERVEGQPLYHE